MKENSIQDKRTSKEMNMKVVITVFWDVMILHNLVHRYLGCDADHKVARFSFLKYNRNHNHITGEHIKHV
jgi:hypothetical protein